VWIDSLPKKRANDLISDYIDSSRPKFPAYGSRLGSKSAVGHREQGDTPSARLIGSLADHTMHANPLALPIPALCRGDKLYRWATMLLLLAEI